MAKEPNPESVCRVLTRQIVATALPLLAYPMAYMFGGIVGHHIGIGPERGRYLMRDVLRLPREDLVGLLAAGNSPEYERLIREYFPERTP